MKGGRLEARLKKTWNPLEFATPLPLSDPVTYTRHLRTSLISILAALPLNHSHRRPSSFALLFHSQLLLLLPLYFALQAYACCLARLFLFYHQSLFQCQCAGLHLCLLLLCYQRESYPHTRCRVLRHALTCYCILH